MGEDFGAQAGSDDIMEACFDDLVTGQGEGCGWKLPKIAINLIAEGADATRKKRLKDTYSIDNAILWGGNLAMLVSLIGTPYLPAIKGGILFVEDVGEHPYRVERMLAQLLQTGILATQKAVIFGQFSGYKLVPHDKGYKLASVVSWLESQVNIPVLTGLPFGHVATKVVLPVGRPVTLAVEGREAFLLWGHHH